MLTTAIVPQLALRRTTHRRHHSHQGARARTWRQLRRLGRTVQHIRLRRKRPAEEGGPVERHHCRLLHRRLARRTRRLQVDAQRRDIVRHPAGRHRGRLDRLQPHDGRQHQARGSPATPHRRRRVTERRPRHGGVDSFLRCNGPKSGSFIISRRSAWVSDERMLFGWFAFTASRIRLRSAFALSSASVLYLVSYTDMICTTSGGVSRRRHELMESCSALCPVHIHVQPTLCALKQAHKTRQQAPRLKTRAFLAAPTTSTYTQTQHLRTVDDSVSRRGPSRTEEGQQESHNGTT